MQNIKTGFKIVVLDRRPSDPVKWKWDKARIFMMLGTQILKEARTVLSLCTKQPTALFVKQKSQRVLKNKPQHTNDGRHGSVSSDARKNGGGRVCEAAGGGSREAQEVGLRLWLWWTPHLCSPARGDTHILSNKEIINKFQIVVEVQSTFASD